MRFFTAAALFLLLASTLDGATTALVLASGAGVEANPLFAFADTVGEALFYFTVLPMAAALLLIPLARRLMHRHADPARLRAVTVLTASRVDATRAAFLLATIPAAVALAKLVFAASNAGLLLTGAPLLPVRHFTMSLLSVSVFAIMLSPFATQALLQLSERSSHA
ncbi:MAG: DUF5658 family protein [Oceanicaulis sp.]